MVLLKYANEPSRWQYVVLYLTKFANCFSNAQSSVNQQLAILKAFDMPLRLRRGIKGSPAVLF